MPLVRAATFFLVMVLAEWAGGHFTAGFAAAQAQEHPSPAGAEKLEKDLRRALKLLEAEQRMIGKIESIRFSRIEARPAEGAYNVVLKSFGIAMEGSISKRSTRFFLAVDKIELRMLPLGDDVYEVTPVRTIDSINVRLPGAGYFKNEKARVQGLGFRFLFSIKHGLFLEGDMSFERIAVFGDRSDLELGPVKVVFDHEISEQGQMDQRVQLSMENYRLRENRHVVMANRSLTADYAYGDWDLNKRLEVLRALPQDTGSDAAASAAHRLSSQPRTIRERLVLDGATLGDNGREVMFEAIASDMTSNFVSDQELNLTAEVSLRGFSLGHTLSKAIPATLLPSDIRLGFDLEGAPLLPLLVLFEDFVEKEDGAANSGRGNETGGVLSKLTKLARQSDATLKLNDFRIALPESDFASEGVLRTNASAALGVEGGFMIEVAGWTRLQGAAIFLTQSRDPDFHELGQTLLQLLGLMQVYAQGPKAPVPSVEGALAYDLKVKPDGAITINGTPLLPPQPSQLPQQ